MINPKNILSKLPSGIKFLIKNYLSAIAIFAIFRTILLFAGLKQLSGVPFGAVLEAYGNGWRFDTSIAGYLLALPTLMTMFAEIIGLRSVGFKRAVFTVLSVLMCASFTVMAADIPYYFIFNARVTSSLFNWFSSPKTVFGYLFETPENYIYMALFAGICFGYVKFTARFLRSWIAASADGKRTGIRALKYTGMYLLACVVLFAGIRGKVFTRRPIAWSEAFTTVYNFPNQLGLNPLFMLGNSLSSSENSIADMKLIDNEVGIETVKEYLGIKNSEFESPVAREVKTEGEAKKYNVVLIIMESMSKAFAGTSENYQVPVTPYLDEIESKSLTFKNTYSLGIHTYNGIWSVFTSTPPPPTEDNPLQYYANALVYSGIGTTLHSCGYDTHFDCPHDINFDNMGGFLSTNGIETVTGLTNELLNKDFINVWGFSDHLLFDIAYNNLRDKTAAKPFFTTILTVSNHSPFNIPEPYPDGFAPRHDEKREIAVEYADWSIRKFMERAEKEPWFDNTIFVFVSDHGTNVLPNYEVNLNYNRIRMFFYAPKIIAPQTVYNFAMQIDLFPTLMGILNIPYINNTMGMDLLREKRRAVYFSANTTIAALDDSLLLIRRSGGERSLFKYLNYDNEDISSRYKAEADALEKYALSSFQTSMWMMNNSAGKPPVKK